MSTTMNTNAPAITHTPGRASNVGLWVLQAVVAFQFAGGRHHEGCATWSACWRWPARSGC